MGTSAANPSIGPLLVFIPDTGLLGDEVLLLLSSVQHVRFFPPLHLGHRQGEPLTPARARLGRTRSLTCHRRKTKSGCVYCVLFYLVHFPQEGASIPCPGCFVVALAEGEAPASSIMGLRWRELRNVVPRNPGCLCMCMRARVLGKTKCWTQTQCKKSMQGCT